LDWLCGRKEWNQNDDQGSKGIQKHWA
jgi:hypothetical protein